MTSAEYAAMHRSYEEGWVLMESLRFWRLTTPTREMFRGIFDLMDGHEYQRAREVIAQVLAEGEAFAKGYEIPSIFIDRWLPDGSAELIAQPWPIRKAHHLDGEIIFCEGKTFRIEDCAVKTRKDDPIRYVSGDGLIYQGSPVPEDETGKILVAPWNNSSQVEKRKFSRYKPFLTPGPRSAEKGYANGI